MGLRATEPFTLNPGLFPARPSTGNPQARRTMGMGFQTWLEKTWSISFEDQSQQPAKRGDVFQRRKHKLRIAPPPCVSTKRHKCLPPRLPASADHFPWCLPRVNPSRPFRKSSAQKNMLTASVRPCRPRYTCVSEICKRTQHCSTNHHATRSQHRHHNAYRYTLFCPTQHHWALRRQSRNNQTNTTCYHMYIQS